MIRVVLRGASVIAACVGLLTVTAVAGARRDRPPARLMVSAREHSLVLSRQTITAGPALIEFLNRGEDPHDLRLRRIGRSPSRTVSAPEVGPGELVQLDARLRAGRYRLWCSLPQHDRRGMHAVLRVRGGR